MTCAYAVRGALMKYEGVEKVDVSLNKGLATVTLKPGNKVRLQDVWETVRKNGFTPKETSVKARAEVVAGNPPRIRVTGSGETFGAASGGKLTTLAGKTVIVEGKLNPTKDGKTAAMAVASIQEGR